MLHIPRPWSVLSFLFSLSFKSELTTNTWSTSWPHWRWYGIQIQTSDPPNLIPTPSSSTATPGPSPPHTIASGNNSEALDRADPAEASSSGSVDLKQSGRPPRMPVVLASAFLSVASLASPTCGQP